MSSQFRDLFPIFRNQLVEQPLIYLDNAATTQKPEIVIDAVRNFYCQDNANIHRGVYRLAERATTIYENTRQAIANFINAKSAHEIIFVRGVTEAINLVATSYGGENFKAQDEIIISRMEHHSNIVPWQLIGEKTGAKLKVITLHENGELDFEHYLKLLTERTKMVAITHISNVLGTINPIKKIIAAAHAYGIPVLIDGAQAIAHLPVDVRELDCDFYTFSAHKMYGPTGIGVLFGKEKLLEAMSPYQGGGDMIKRVTFAKTEYAELPHKFEAGTAAIAEVVGLGATLDFINSVGIPQIARLEQELLESANLLLSQVSGLKIIGSASEKSGIISFVLDQIHPHDVATILDTENIAIRAGHHCAMPLMDFYGLPGTNRVSFGLYNTEEEINILLSTLSKVKKIFGS